MAGWGKNNVRLQVILPRAEAKKIQQVARHHHLSISKMLRRLLATVTATPVQP